MLHQIKLLIQKDFKLLNAYRSGIMSVALYMSSFTFLIYTMMHIQGALVQLEVKYWNILYWLVVLFTIITLVHQYVSIDRENRYHYYFGLIDARAFILAKIIFVSILSVIMSIVAYTLFYIWLGNPVTNTLYFLFTIILSSFGLSIVYTLTSALSLGSVQSWLLSSILGFPLSLPILLFTSRMCRESFAPNLSEQWMNTAGTLFGFDLIMIILSYILYPYIWKSK